MAEENSQPAEDEPRGGSDQPVECGEEEEEYGSDSPLESDCDSVSGSEESDGENSTKSTRLLSGDTIQEIIENGRRYCNETYFMPNDDAEQTRLNITHQIYLILLDGELLKAPLVKGPSRVLDIGTGPGDWAIELGEQYPNAEIIATDISVFDAGPSSVDLPNVFFQLDDAEDEWAYHEPFDLVHLRGLSGAFSDWGAIYRRAFHHLKPGGHIEVADADVAADIIDIPNSRDSYFSIWVSAMHSAAEACGYPRNQDHLRPAALTEAGFVNVRVYDLTLPVGMWPEEPREKTLGKMALIALLEGLEAASLRQLTATGNWSADAVRDLCDKVKMELVTAHGMTARVRIITAKKPLPRTRTWRERNADALNDALKRLEIHDEQLAKDMARAMEG
ncbi:hypothetical protein VTN02DRAFT_1152 [Thermoascus thermophilus]